MTKLLIGTQSEIGKAITRLIEQANACKCMDRDSGSLLAHGNGVNAEAHHLCKLLAMKAQQVREEEAE